MNQTKPILIVGATGYVGGRLVPQLLDAGYRVRAMDRSLAKLEGRPWGSHPQVELIEGNVLDLESLRNAVKGCAAGYYLVHSMNPNSKDFAQTDRAAAENMVSAAAAAGLERLIYLGGLGRADDPNLSEHLKSRHEVARIFQTGPVPATVLRAAMILGSGSASFEMLRYLSDRLPVMITPRWVNTLCQPIAIRNVLHYLQGCLEHEETIGGTFDIGGADVISYRRLIETYVEEARLPKRRIIPVPFFSPHLSSYWVHLITPIPASLARPLTEGLGNRAVCLENRIQAIIPQPLLSCRESIRMALEEVQQGRVETCWSDAGSCQPPEWTHCGDAPYAGGTIMKCGYRVRLQASPEEVWEPIVRIGGLTGYYFGDALWLLRGWIDRLAGGVGLVRGRRDNKDLYAGDALDFWRVLEIVPRQRLYLLAEMKMPGEATLEFSLQSSAPGTVELQAVSRFLPKGLGGILYWYVLFPFHEWLFFGMLRSIAEAVGKPMVSKPERFTPALSDACAIHQSMPEN